MPSGSFHSCPEPVRVPVTGVFLGVLLIIVGFGEAPAGDWPSFRGSRGDGIAADDQVPLQWGPEKNVRWRYELPGPGNSSPIVSNGRVFVTVATDEGRKRHLICLDRVTGREVWKQTVEYDRVAPTHQTNPYCGSTPVADGQRVVVWHGSAGVYCYDFDGRELWHTSLGQVGHIWGYGSSPILHKGKVILNFGPGEDTFLVALDLETGQELWRTDEPGGANDRSPRMVGSWSTPIVVSIDGQDQILCSMPTRVVAYAPSDGEILWTCGGLPSPRGDLVYTSVVTDGAIGVAMGGYKGPALGIRLADAKGDVTDSHRLWHVERQQPQRIGSGVIVDGKLYMANAGPGTYQCIDIRTGETLWQERLSGDHWGSMVYAGGHLFVTNQDGVTRVLRPNPEQLEVMAENSLGESSNATPAISDGELFLRTNQAVYCISDTSQPAS